MSIHAQAQRLASLAEQHYQCHGINIRLRLHSYLRDYQHFIFRVVPMPGTKIDGVFERAADIQAALQIHLFQPFRDGVLIFLAVSQLSVRENSLRKMLTSPAFRNSKATLPIALGYDLMGRMVFADLEKMPHAMYAGATRSGKSVGLLCLAISLVCKHPVSEVNLIIFDIGANTLEVLENVPHLSHPIVKDRDPGIHVIQSLMDEMERRIALSGSALCDLPAIICIIDEYISFIDSIDNKQKREKVVNNISNLLRRGRKAKVHMVLATQNPKNKAMGVDLDNITSRMAFKVARFQTSIAILNCAGAEKLPGNGALLYQSVEYPEPIYIQGAYMPEIEIEQLVTRINGIAQSPANKFVIPEAATSDYDAVPDALPGAVQPDSEEEEEFVNIVLWTLEHNAISVEKLKRRFSMGNRANRIMDKLCEAGLVSTKFSNQPRSVLPHSVEDIPDAVMNLLTRGGIPSEEVAMAFSRRSSDDLAVSERGDSHAANC